MQTVAKRAESGVHIRGERPSFAWWFFKIAIGRSECFVMVSSQVGIHILQTQNPLLHTKPVLD
jgi:hypothetical protein